MFSFGFNVKPRVIVAGGGGYDPDAEAFFTAASITDTTQKSAVNQLVLDLKSYGVWTKCNAIYPIVGGNASSHAVNLKTPGTYNLTFATGMTHSSTGMLPNGSTAYANTFLATSVIGLNTGHLSFYSRTNSLSAASKSSIGSLRPQSGANSYSDLGMGSINQDYFRYNNTGTYDNIAATNTLGFYNGSRTAGGTIKLFKNGTAIINGTAVSQATSSVSFYISAANNNGTAAYYDNKECSFASIGSGLSITEAANYYTAVQAYQTTLSRQV